MLNKILTLLFVLVFSISTTVAIDLPEASLTDDMITEGQTLKLTNDKVWVLEEMVFVEDGAMIEIEPGTIIWGKPGQEENAKALVIARGGKIHAVGTPTEPIIFTAYGDDPFDLNDGFDVTATGQWGGVIILGKAPNNNLASDGVKNIEGIPETNPKGKYGAPLAEADPMDNSGTLKYVQIRHGGTDIGDGNEINGLTMGAVGAGTTVDYVEVWYNKDDGFEWFGGTVKCSHLVSAFNGDDSFDYDEGWTGGGQFWFSIQDETRGGNGGEHDGGNKPDDSEPYATPVIYNVTYIGSGVDSDNSKSNGLHLRDNAGGKYYNSIFTDMSGKGLDIEDLEADDPNSAVEDSRKRLEAGDLILNNNIWWNIGSANTDLQTISPDVTGEDAYGQQFVRDYLADAANNNWIDDPMLLGISRNLGGPSDPEPAGGLDPRPTLGSPALTYDVADLPEGDGWYTKADYIGAFGPQDTWMHKWTFLYEIGLLPKKEVEEVSLFDNSIKEGEKLTLTSDKIWVLEEMIFVEDGAELHIEPGTLIWAKPGQEENAKALVIARGGKIFAEGTPTKPIIFTAYGDDPYNLEDGFELTSTGMWGGVILLGKAPTNNVASNGVKNIEGIPETNPKGKYGAPLNEADPMDNSGVMRYVQIRHGGTDIGDGNEINGLTMGAVGAGTTIEYVEVWYNKDDGFEWFGGTVKCSHLVSAFNGDDSYDYDEGWTGGGQFWFSIQDETRGGNGGEHDGGNKPDDSEPYSKPVIYNVTYIGSGVDSDNSKSNGLHLRDNAGGKYYNSIFTDMSGKGIDIEDLEADDPNSTVEDSRKRLEAGDLVLNNNIWWNIGSTNTNLETIAPDVTGDGGYGQQFVRDYLGNASNNNWIEDPMIMSVSRKLGGPVEGDPDGGLYPVPAYDSPAFTNDVADVPDDMFYTQVDYIGAFGKGDLWLDNWTFLSQCGLLKPLRQGEESLTDASIKEGETLRLTADKIWVLDEMVFVEEGAELHIEPGTVIWGKPGQEEDAKALVIARGGKIFAEGTQTQPIIFTAYGDDPYNMDDLELTATGLWGGVILLGKAPTNNLASNGVKNIEGIPETNPKGKYGAPLAEADPMDNSGVVKYVQIRHGGTDIGDGNEINGLTMGAVGAETEISHVEVWYNKDDGFEWFGGTVHTSYLVSAFNGDDSYDYDEGFNGKGQFWFSIQDDTRGGNSGEHDGGNKPDDSEPYAIPLIYNVTYIGSGIDADNSKSNTLHLRDNAGGKYFNSIFTEMTNKGVEIEDLESTDPNSAVEDSRKRLESYDLQIQNNLWWNIGSENTSLQTISPDVTGEDGYSQQFVREYLGNSENNNWVEDPKLMGISRNLGGPTEEDPDGGLDPRPDMQGPAYTKPKATYYYRADENANNFFKAAEYIGAFGQENWLVDWTFLSMAGVTNAKGGMKPHLAIANGEKDPYTSVEELNSLYDVRNDINVYPNPVNTDAEVQFHVNSYSNIKVEVFNLMGQKVVELVNKPMAAGLYGITWNASNLTDGVYIIKLTAGNNVSTVKAIVE